MIREADKTDVYSLVSIYEQCFPGKGYLLNNVLLSFDTKTLIYGQKSYADGMIVSMIDCGDPWIWILAVRPDFQGQGIGTSLLKEIEKYYTKEINLYVNVDNPAQKLYFDNGYRVKKVLKDIYDGGDALHMRKKLNN